MLSPWLEIIRSPIVRTEIYVAWWNLLAAATVDLRIPISYTGVMSGRNNPKFLSQVGPGLRSSLKSAKM
jgi:hypothetical protein